MKTMVSKMLAKLMRKMMVASNIPMAYRHVALGKVEAVIAALGILTWDEMCMIEYSL